MFRRCTAGHAARRALAGRCRCSGFQMRLTCAARTDPGRRRENNEDSFCIREDLGLFLVADGMGGHVAGEIASRLVVEEVERFVATTAPASTDPERAPAGTDPADGGDRLTAALVEANRALARRIRQGRRVARHGDDRGRVARRRRCRHARARRRQPRLPLPREASCTTHERPFLGRGADARRPVDGGGGAATSLAARGDAAPSPARPTSTSRCPISRSNPAIGCCSAPTDCRQWFPTPGSPPCCRPIDRPATSAASWCAGPMRRGGRTT